jgi:hypothetical protein
VLKRFAQIAQTFNNILKHIMLKRAHSPPIYLTVYTPSPGLGGTGEGNADWKDGMKMKKSGGGKMLRHSSNYYRDHMMVLGSLLLDSNLPEPSTIELATAYSFLQYAKDYYPNVCAEFYGLLQSGRAKYEAERH